MTSARNFKGQIRQGCDSSFLARVEYQGSPIVQANVTTIDCVVQQFSRSTGVKTVTFERPDGMTSIDPADVIYDVLQTDSRWVEDSEGYNFLLTIPGDAFPSVEPTFILITITTTADAIIKIAFEPDIVSNRGL